MRTRNRKHVGLPLDAKVMVVDGYGWSAFDATLPTGLDEIDLTGFCRH